jgi:hypothetical protein
MVNLSMSRSAAHAPLLITVTLALAAGTAPLVAQRSETTRRTVRVTVSDSSERQLRQLERTIDSLARVFEAGDLSSAERARVGRTIDALVAKFRTQRMQPDGPNTIVKMEGPYIVGTPEPPMVQGPYVELKGTLPPLLAARGWIGIVVSGAPREIHTEGNQLMMRFLSYPEIVSVDPSSPAQRGGLAAGDTLLAYDGQDVRGADISMTRLLRPNAKVIVRVRRDGRIKELPVVVAEVPSRIRIRKEGEMREATQSWFTPTPDVVRVSPIVPSAPAVPPRAFTFTSPPSAPMAPGPVGMSLPRPFEFSPSGVAGAQLVTISDGIKRSLGLQSGVLVVRVPDGTLADASGLKEGDIIVRVERQPVQSVVQLWQIVTRADENGAREVNLDLIREKQARELKLRW